MSDDQGNRYSSESVALYVFGENLDADHVTRIIGIEPTETRRKGRIRSLSSGSIAHEKRGAWILRVSGEGSDIGSLISGLIENVSSKDVDILRIDNVEEAYLDIFVAISIIDEGVHNCSFVLSEKDVSRISKMGVPVQITFGASK